ncbi:MAG: lysine biosynthesis protein LysX [Planctomycetes bacterium]|nr:lysine biosynthesis protein LysX [Planctomycetota bacterium]
MSDPLLFLHTRLRLEEKLLLQVLARRGVDFQTQDLRKLQLHLDSPAEIAASLVWDRSLSFGRSLAAMQVFASNGVTCLNDPAVIATCGDKLRTQLALTEHGLPTPRTRACFSPEAALEACEELGYPVVTKPTVGSWGRLASRLNDRDAAEAVFEHRDTLGDWTHGVLFLQEYVDKPGRDLRVFVIGDEVIAAIERRSEHWITNTARGAQTANRALEPDLVRLAQQAAAAVGGGQLAIDLIERRDGELLVLEVNHSMEFRNSIEVTGVDIPGRMVDDALTRSQEGVPG